MTFLGAIKSTFVNYFNFSGRASRSEYWFFILFMFLVGIILTTTVAPVPTDNNLMQDAAVFEKQPIIIVYQLFFLIPLLSFSCRRLHDMNYCNWWILIYFIPFVGPIALYIWFIFPSDPQENKYGPNPMQPVTSLLDKD